VPGRFYQTLADGAGQILVGSDAPASGNHPRDQVLREFFDGGLAGPWCLRRKGVRELRTRYTDSSVALLRAGRVRVAVLPLQGLQPASQLRVGANLVLIWRHADRQR
jgi:hypothetical protein